MDCSHIYIYIYVYISCYSCSVVTICGTYNVISQDELFYFHVSTFWSMCAVPGMAVFVLFSMLLRYILNDCKMAPVASIITGITFVYYYYY